MEFNAVKWFADEFRLNMSDDDLREIATSEEFAGVRVPLFELAPLLYRAPRDSFAPFDEYGPLNIGFNKSYWHMFLRDPQVIRDEEILARQVRSHQKVFIGRISKNVSDTDVVTGCLPCVATQRKDER